MLLNLEIKFWILLSIFLFGYFIFLAFKFFQPKFSKPISKIKKIQNSKKQIQMLNLEDFRPNLATTIQEIEKPKVENKFYEGGLDQFEKEKQLQFQQDENIEQYLNDENHPEYEEYENKEYENKDEDQKFDSEENNLQIIENGASNGDQNLELENFQAGPQIESPIEAKPIENKNDFQTDENTGFENPSEIIEDNFLENNDQDFFDSKSNEKNQSQKIDNLDKNFESKSYTLKLHPKNKTSLESESDFVKPAYDENTSEDSSELSDTFYEKENLDTQEGTLNFSQDYDEKIDDIDQKNTEKVENERLENEKLDLTHDFQAKKREKELQSKITALRYEALALKETGSYGSYERKLIEGLSLDQDNIEFIEMLGNLYFYEEKYSKALALLKRAHQLDFENHNILWQMGYIFARRGENKKAIDYYNHALELKPENTKYLMSLVDIYYDQKKYDLALQYALYAVELKPTNITYVLAAGAIYESLGDDTRAQDFYAYAYNLDPNHPIVQKKLLKDI